MKWAFVHHVLVHPLYFWILFAPATAQPRLLATIDRWHDATGAKL